MLKTYSTYMRASNFGHILGSHLSVRLIRGSTYTRVYTVPVLDPKQLQLNWNMEGHIKQFIEKCNNRFEPVFLDSKEKKKNSCLFQAINNEEGEYKSFFFFFRRNFSRDIWMQIFFLQYARPMNKLGKCISTNFTFFS